MDLQQAYYEQRFENLFLKSKGNTFQEFFEKLMGLLIKLILWLVDRGEIGVTEKMMAS